MRGRYGLRVVERKNSELSKLCSILPGSKVVRLSMNRRYVNVDLHNDLSDQINALLDIDIWLDVKDIELPEIPWKEVPLPYLVHWLIRSDTKFFFNNEVWHINGGSIPDNVQSEMLQLMSEPCPLLVCDWQFPSESKKKLLSELPLELRFVLGYSDIPLSEIMNLTSGDILLITRQLQRIVYRDNIFFDFIYQHNSGVIVNDRVLGEKIADYQNAENEYFEWSELPVEVEFVLDKMILKLVDLDNISKGDILPITDEAEKNIRIYVNKKLLAAGELVELDNKLAVELKELYKN
ncbi:hypothetical protein EZW88_23730 [Salmonella enterica subsp. enterica serovar Bredeney]|nr:hypothetical protein [Salmonella enterica subsp. enterica serovar Bredeney]ECD3237271.1 hypothetical protein [Salmonella enterica subsp. enterica serovar Bredeney]EDO5628541.1 hypothetical protein [Salmonella enterica]